MAVLFDTPHQGESAYAICTRRDGVLRVVLLQGTVEGFRRHLAAVDGMVEALASVSHVQVRTAS